MKPNKMRDAFFGGIYALFRQRANEAAAERYGEAYERAELSRGLFPEDLGILPLGEPLGFVSEKGLGDNVPSDDGAVTPRLSVDPLVLLSEENLTLLSADGAAGLRKQAEIDQRVFNSEVGKAVGAEILAPEAVFNSEAVNGSAEVQRRAEIDRAVFNSEAGKTVGAEMLAPKTVFNSEIVSGAAGMQKRAEIDRAVFNSEVGKTAGAETLTAKTVFNSETLSGAAGVQKQAEIDCAVFNSEVEKSAGAETLTAKTVFNSETLSGAAGVQKQAEIDCAVFNSEVEKSAGAEILAPKAVFDSEAVSGSAGLQRQADINQTVFNSEVGRGAACSVYQEILTDDVRLSAAVGAGESTFDAAQHSFEAAALTEAKTAAETQGIAPPSEARPARGYETGEREKAIGGIHIDLSGMTNNLGSGASAEELAALIAEAVTEAAETAAEGLHR